MKRVRERTVVSRRDGPADYLVKTVVLVGTLCIVAACGADVDSETEASAMTTTLVGGHEMALHGTNSFSSCDTDQIDELTDGQRIGRIASRSAALLECVSEAAANGVPKYESSVDFGPYIHCDWPGGGEDAFGSASFDEQVGRIINISASRLDTDHDCSAAPPGVVSSPQASAPYSLSGGDENIDWKRVGPARDNAWLMWHEAVHNHDYRHNEAGGTCSYDDGSAALDSSRHSAPNIYSKCMLEVIYQSDESPECQSLSCESDELAIVKRYGEYAAGDDCECVPDVFSWPSNQNESGDRFGHSLATGDFDDDGHEDLAVGAPGEGGDIGAVYVFRGSAYGLRFWKRTSQWYIVVTDYAGGGSTFTPGQSFGDEFGAALAAGDLNNDGYDDLLVGAPGRASDKGVVYIFPGGPLGLDNEEVQWLDQSESGGALEAGDRFGASLVVGNFNNDAYDDFAVGAPGEVYSGSASGVVSVHRGRSATTGAQSFEHSDGILHQAMGGFSNENGDEFGYALSAGDVDGDGSDELVIGGPGENSGDGYAFIFEKDGSWSVMTGINPGSSYPRFGEAVAVGDFISTSEDDIAIGSPDYSSGAGAVRTYRGTSTTPTFAQTLTGNETDAFGAALAIGNVGIGKGDLIVGMPGEEFGSGPEEGRVAVYSGVTGTELGSVYRYLTEYMFFDGGSGDSIIPPEHHGTDGLGHSLVLLRMPGTSTRGVVAGAPTDTVDGAQAGAVFQYATLVADRKLDQLTMRYGNILPY